MMVNWLLSYRRSVDIPLAASVASSWLWGLGFFYSIHVTLTYGALGFLLFAIPNAVGLALFGVVLERRSDLPKWWARVRARYLGFLILYQVAAVAITLFAAGVGFFAILAGDAAGGAVIVLAIVGCLFGHLLGLGGLRRAHAPLLIAGIASAIYVVWFLHGVPAPTIPHDTSLDRRFAGLVLPTLVGFLLGPWLDVQQWQRAVAIRAVGRSVGRTYLVGAAMFFGLLCVNAMLATSAGLVSLRIPSDGIPEAVGAVTSAASVSGLALIAFGIWVVIAMGSTLDSFYVASRAMLIEAYRASNNPLLALLPSGLATSPFWMLLPAMGLALAGMGAGAPMMAFLAPFATVLTGAAACLVAETMRGPSEYDPVVCLCSGALAAIAFAIGYEFNLPALLWLSAIGAILPVIPHVLGSAGEQPVAAGAPVTLSSEGPMPVSSAPSGREVGAGFSPDGWFVMPMTTTYDDTNSVGNVYFANYMRFVGKCRELFFLECMPDFDLKTSSFHILTKDFDHKFRREIREFQPILVMIRIKSYNRRFVTLEHEIRMDSGALIGRGEQDLMFVTPTDQELLDIPSSVMRAFLPHFQRASGNSGILNAVA